MRLGQETTTMNTKSSLHIATREDRAAGASGEAQSEGLTTIIGALVVMTCFAAPLLLTLPQTMDAAASPAPMIREAVAADSNAPTFHERHPLQAGTDWSDPLEQSVVAR
jgi:hypothetical protein